MAYLRTEADGKLLQETGGGILLEVDAIAPAAPVYRAPVTITDYHASAAAWQTRAALAAWQMRPAIQTMILHAPARAWIMEA